MLKKYEQITKLRIGLNRYLPPRFHLPQLMKKIATFVGVFDTSGAWSVWKEVFVQSVSSSESDKSGDENEAPKVETQVTVTWRKTVTKQQQLLVDFRQMGFVEWEVDPGTKHYANKAPGEQTNWPYRSLSLKPRLFLVTLGQVKDLVLSLGVLCGGNVLLGGRWHLYCYLCSLQRRMALACNTFCISRLFLAPEKRGLVQEGGWRLSPEFISFKFRFGKDRFLTVMVNRESNGLGGWTRSDNCGFSIHPDGSMAIFPHHALTHTPLLTSCT